MNASRSCLLCLVLILSSLCLAQTDRQITVATSAQPDTLDPQRTAATASFQILWNIYDTLLSVDREGLLAPGLARDWEVSGDGLTYTFTLRDGITFQSGSSLDAEDVVATLERILDPATEAARADQFSQVERVQAAGPLEVEIILNEPSPPFLATLASGWSAILPAEAVTAGFDFATATDGTGPYTLSEFVRDSHLILVANPDYWGGAPEVESVRVQFVTDAAVAVQGLLAGTFDLVPGVTFENVETLRGAGIQVDEQPSSTVLVMPLNNRLEYLSDPRVRQALTMAIDRETLLEVGWGSGQVVGTYIDPQSPYFVDLADRWPYDPERARTLLHEAGVPPGWEIELSVPQDFEPLVRAGEVIQAMLAEVEVRATLRPVEFGVWLSTISQPPHDFEVGVFGHTGRLDQDGRLRGWGDPEETYIGYDNPQVADSLQRAARETDETMRARLYQEVLDQIAEDAPMVFLGVATSYVAVSPELEGFWITPYLDTYNFVSVTFVNSTAQ